MMVYEFWWKYEINDANSFLGYLLFYFFYSSGHIIPNLNEAIKSFHKYTCLRFVPYDYTQRNYILFGNKDG